MLVGPWWCNHECKLPLWIEIMCHTGNSLHPNNGPVLRHSLVKNTLQSNTWTAKFRKCTSEKVSCWILQHYLVEVHHFVLCITWTYLDPPLPSSCGWQKMKKQQQRGHVTVPVYQGRNKAVMIKNIKQSISNINQPCRKAYHFLHSLWVSQQLLAGDTQQLTESGVWPLWWPWASRRCPTSQATWSLFQHQRAARSPDLSVDHT